MRAKNERFRAGTRRVTNTTFPRANGLVYDIGCGPRHAPVGAPHVRFSSRPAHCRTGYSWVPGTGLNLIPRNATPVGAAVDASMVIAVQMMLA
jgi:hypothetical protein